MERKSIGRRIWEITNPILVNLGVAFVVEWIILAIYYVPHFPRLMQMELTQEQLIEEMLELANVVYQYVVEISAISALLTIPILIFMKRKDGQKERKCGILPNKKAPLYKYLYIAVVGICLAVVANNILTLANLAEYSESYQKVEETLYAPSLPIQILCLGIIIPVCEEYVFRGLIYRRMRNPHFPMGAIISSSMIFGLYHMNGVQFLYATVCGVFLAYVYEKYGSMKAPILAHVLMNTVVCLLSEANAFTWMFSQTVRMALVTAICAAVGSSVFLLIRQIDEKPERVAVEPDEK